MVKKTAVVTTAMGTLLFEVWPQACASVVIRRALSISLVMGVIIALAGSVAEGETGVSLVMNGSFENDGPIGDIGTNAPQYWCDVNIPTDKFLGWIDSDWSSYGNYSLNLYSGFGTFIVGEMAGVSQLVHLTDVNRIIFDVELITTEGQPWPEGKRSAVLLIDREDIIWDSNNMAPSGSGEYFGVAVDVNEKYKDANSHILSLAIKANVSETEYFYEYLARWDFVKFDAYCGGFGYLWEDLNQDCYVNMLDLEMLAGQWLAEDPNEEYDLFQDGIVDFHDFAFFAKYWMSNTYWENWLDDNCFEMELLAGDLNNDGTVNLRDFAILARDWIKEGNCIRGDIDRSEIVDCDDLSKLVDEWLQINWLYGL